MPQTPSTKEEGAFPPPPPSAPGQPEAAAAAMRKTHQVRLILGGIGAVAGGVFGVAAFVWIARQGFYGLILPGFFTGLAAQWLARTPCKGLGLFCAAVALPLGLVAEWWEFPFVADGSLRYFLTHVHELRPLTWLMLLAGMFLAYVDGKGSVWRR